MICPHGTVPPFSGPEISTDQGSHIEWLNIVYKCTWSMLKAESWVVERCVVVQQLLLLHPSTLARYLQQLMAEELPTARYILTGHPTIAKERSLFQASNTQMKPKMSKDVFQFCVGVVVSSVAAAVDDHLAGLKKTKINRARARRLSSMKMIKPLYKDSAWETDGSKQHDPNKQNTTVRVSPAKSHRLGWQAWDCC